MSEAQRKETQSCRHRAAQTCSSSRTLLEITQVKIEMKIISFEVVVHVNVQHQAQGTNFLYFVHDIVKLLLAVTIIILIIIISCYMTDINSVIYYSTCTLSNLSSNLGMGPIITVQCFKYLLYKTCLHNFCYQLLHEMI